MEACEKTRCALNLPGPNGGTCLSRHALLFVADALKINTDNIDDTSNVDILKAIRKSVNGCASDRCLFTHFLSPMFNWKDFFAPIKDGANSLITDEDIYNVCYQLCRKYADCFYFTALASDRKPLMSRDLSLSEVLDRGSNHLIIPFNEDTDGNPGTHWVGVYMDIRPLRESPPASPTLCFYNSLGELPISNFVDWFIRLAKQIKAIWGLDMPIMYNKKKHQDDRNKECGVYMLYFFMQMLQGVPYDEFLKRDIGDSAILSIRWRDMFQKPCGEDAKVESKSNI
jgi:hypothetical protein